MKKILIYGIGLTLISLAGACSDKDDWQPGELSEAKNQVYFKTVVSEDDLEPGQTGAYSVVLAREDAKGAIDVPIKISGSELFSFPSIVRFEDGESQKTVELTFNGTPNKGYYKAYVEIEPGEFNSLYTSRVTTMAFTMLVAKWNKVADATAIPTYYDDYFQPIDCEVYEMETEKWEDKQYRVKGFLNERNLTFAMNTITYSKLNFDADGNALPYSAYLKPTGGYVLSADPIGWGYSCWAMFDQGSVYDDSDDAEDAWVTLPNTADGVRLFNPVIINDASSYRISMIYNKSIEFMLAFFLYEDGDDWTLNETIYYELWKLEFNKN